MATSIEAILMCCRRYGGITAMELERLEALGGILDRKYGHYDLSVLVEAKDEIRAPASLTANCGL